MQVTNRYKKATFAALDLSALITILALLADYHRSYADLKQAEDRSQEGDIGACIYALVLFPHVICLREQIYEILQPALAENCVYCGMARSDECGVCHG